MFVIIIDYLRRVNNKTLVFQIRILMPSLLTAQYVWPTSCNYITTFPPLILVNSSVRSFSIISMNRNGHVNKHQCL